MSKQSIRVVLDTNQIVGAGTRWLDLDLPAQSGSTCRRILIRVATFHTGLYCGKIIGEYLEKLVDRNHPHDRAVKMMAYIMGAFNRVSLTTQAAPYPPSDSDDEVFLLCAIDGQAGYLVSEDRSLLELKANYSSFAIGRSLDLVDPLGA
jgi:PIN domain